MIKSKFAISLHILTLLALEQEEWLTSTYIAGSLNVNPVLVRKEISNLKAFGLLESKEGKNGGVRLLKAPSAILLSDIFKAALGDDHVFSFSKNTPNPHCPVGKQINKNLDFLFTDINDGIEAQLSQTTLESFKNQF